jgi:hypothetical protein
MNAMNTAMHVVEAALQGVRDELAKHQAMLADLRIGAFVAERDWIAHSAVDTWPLTHEVTDLVCKAAEAYRRAGRHTQCG